MIRSPRALEYSWGEDHKRGYGHEMERRGNEAGGRGRKKGKGGQRVGKERGVRVPRAVVECSEREGVERGRGRGEGGEGESMRVRSRLD